MDLIIYRINLYIIIIFSSKESSGTWMFIKIAMW
jgi:hypothetical protein